MVDIPDDFSTTARFEGAAAGTSSAKATYSGTFDTENDIDFIRVTLSGTETYSFYISAESYIPSVSFPLIELFDANGVAVGTSSTIGIGLDARLIISPPPHSGIYYLAVSNQLQFRGDYSVVMTIANTPVDKLLTDGDDSYTGAFNERIIGGRGNDIISIGLGEQALGGSGADDITGNAANNDIYGGLGNDIVKGGDGLDLLFGEAGNDTLKGEGGDDVIFGGDGNDNIETGGGVGGETAHGGAGDDTVIGGTALTRLLGEAGNDYLDGGAGGDAMQGGDGNDIYIVRQADDAVYENFASGTDTIISTVSFRLADTAHVFGVVEHLTLSGAGALNGNGNGVANILTGALGANQLNGNAGNDTLIGNGGADRLIGGAGRDLLTGGAGADRFVYLSASDSRGAAVDRITDFQDAGADKIDLSAYSGLLSYRGSGAFTGTGQVRIADVSGPDLLVQVNLSGTLAPDLTIRLLHTTAASMSASDFVL